MKHTPHKPTRSSLKIAGHLTADDKQILRDHAASLKKHGGTAAQRELLNEAYWKIKRPKYP